MKKSKDIGKILIDVFIALIVVSFIYELMRYYTDGVFLVNEIVSKTIIQAVVLILVWFRLKSEK